MLLSDAFIDESNVSDENNSSDDSFSMDKNLFYNREKSYVITWMKMN